MTTKKQPTGYKYHRPKPLAHYVKRTIKKITGGKRRTVRKVKLS